MHQNRLGALKFDYDDVFMAVDDTDFSDVWRLQVKNCELSCLELPPHPKHIIYDIRTTNL